MTTSNAKIIVCDGDQTGQELLVEALRVMDPAILGVALELIHYDLSLEKRRATNNDIVREAAEAMVETGLGLKASKDAVDGYARALYRYEPWNTRRA